MILKSILPVVDVREMYGARNSNHVGYDSIKQHNMIRFFNNDINDRSSIFSEMWVMIIDWFLIGKIVA